MSFLRLWQGHLSLSRLSHQKAILGDVHDQLQGLPLSMIQDFTLTYTFLTDS